MLNLPSRAREFAICETKEWFKKNGSYDFKLVGFYEHNIVLVLICNYSKYLIEIEYPSEYPRYKKEHKLSQLFPSNVEFRFIQKINAECMQKNINLSQIFACIYRYLNKFQQIEDVIHQVRQGNILYATRMHQQKYSAEQIFVDKIKDTEIKQLSKKIKECVLSLIHI